MTNTPLSDHLKQYTAEMHKRAEQNLWSRSLMNGSLPREAYLDWLEQMMIVHRELETQIDTLLQFNPELTELINPEQFQTRRAVGDLEALGRNPRGAAPLPATSRFRRSLKGAATLEPCRLIGIWYVMEGSKNGGRILGVLIRRMYGLEPGPGTQYLDSYGGDQRRLWAEFRERLNAMPFTEGERESIASGAREAFALMSDIHQQLLPLMAEAV